MLTVALPKGRIAKESLDIFSKIFNRDFKFEGRELIMELIIFQIFECKKSRCSNICRTWFC